MITPSRQEIDKVKKIAVRIACDRGYSHIAQDFASWLLLETVKRGPQKYVEKRFVDYLRLEGGRDSKGKKASLNGISKRGKLRNYNLVSRDDSSLHAFQFADHLKDMTLTEEQRILVWLYFYFNATLKEIAAMMQITEGAVSLKLSAIL